MNIVSAFSGFSVDDITKAETFYGQTLGLQVDKETAMDLLTIHLPGGDTIMAYPKPDHTPAAYTALNLVVENIDQAVDELAAKGVAFEKYEGFGQDEKGIARSEDPAKGPNITWFKDPAGNILAVLQK